MPTLLGVGKAHDYANALRSVQSPRLRQRSYSLRVAPLLAEYGFPQFPELKIIPIGIIFGILFCFARITVPTYSLCVAWVV